MAKFDSGRTLADRFRRHAADSDHLYAHLMRGMADDWESGGVVAETCRGWENAPTGSVVQLRLLAGLFRIVLTDRAPELEEFYPCLGGATPPESAWPVARDVMSRHVGELREALEIAPQTNEVGRSAALLVGLFQAVRRSGLARVRLLEPGASAGLNLLVDEFRFVNSGWSFGREDSPLVLRDQVVGDLVPVRFEIVSRRGCDLAPVDASTSAGRLRLRSFIWPFQVERHERLSAALEIAARHPVTVDRAGAGEWLEEQLDRPVPDDVLTVVWQSVTRLYWPAEETSRVKAAVEAAAARSPTTHLAMEYPVDADHDMATLTLDEVRVGNVERQGGPVTLADVGDHGNPVRLSTTAT